MNIPEDKQRTAEIELAREAQRKRDLSEPMQVSFAPTPLEAQCRILASLPMDQQQAMADALLEEMRGAITRAVCQFEQKTGLVVDSVSIEREVLYCGFPQPVITASACSVEEFKKTPAYLESRKRHEDRIRSHGMFGGVAAADLGRPFYGCGYSPDTKGDDPDA